MPPPRPLHVPPSRQLDVPPPRPLPVPPFLTARCAASYTARKAGSYTARCTAGFAALRAASFPARCRLPYRSLCRLLNRVTYRLPRRLPGRLFSRSAIASLAALVGPPYSAVCSRLAFVGLHGAGFSRVWSYGQGDTGTACTSTALWDLSAHGNKAYSPQTDGSAVCRYAY